MRLLIQICAIAVIVATIFICATKPNMHKTVLVYNSDYKLVQTDDVQTETIDIKLAELPAKPQTQTVQNKTETVIAPKTQTTVPKVVQTPKSQKTVQTFKSEPKTTVKTKPVAVKSEQTHIPQTQTVTKQEVKQEPQVVQTQTVPKVLTQKEEEIAWNVWRSNLQNQIMQDVKLPALPNGIVFRFSFNVDKYGKITNIYTSSDNPAFTPYAIQYIAPIIRSYQGKSILNFPEGSSRTATEFKGGWKISANERLSTPQDYNDYEKVVKY